jgi:Na+-driven multidrug efflux pump
LISLFTRDPTVARFAVNCLRAVSCGFVFYGYGMVISQAFNGAGDTLTPTLLNLFCFWVWEIPIAYLLSHYTGLGANGVFFSIAIAFSTLAIVSIAIFRRGRWKRIVV